MGERVGGWAGGCFCCYRAVVVVCLSLCSVIFLVDVVDVWCLKQGTGVGEGSMGTGGVVILSDCFETVRCISWYGGGGGG